MIVVPFSDYAQQSPHLGDVSIQQITGKTAGSSLSTVANVTVTQDICARSTATTPVAPEFNRRFWNNRGQLCAHAKLVVADIVAAVPFVLDADRPAVRIDSGVVANERGREARLYDPIRKCGVARVHVLMERGV